jgi:undecaprenyl pyrophosphate phosphatase UppP
VQDTAITFLGALVVAFTLGFVWYAPFGLGASWLEALGKSREELGSPGRVLGGTVAALVASAFALDLLMRATGVRTIPGGAWLGLGAGGVAAALMLSDYLSCGWPLRLFAIQAGYRVAYLVLMGVVLGARP